MRNLAFACAAPFLLLLPAIASASDDSTTDTRPNIIVIFTDDQGYNDLGCFGSEKIKTPRIDQMAAEGARFTNFYAQAVCGPSRAALMTGCYPIRVGEPGNKKNQHTIPHADEITVAEVLQAAGYKTGCIGKWHLGQKTQAGWDPGTMPNGQGFDYFYGTPLYNGFTVYVDDTKFRSPILRNEETVVEAVESWDNITKEYTDEAVAFIRENRERPFFLYLAHNMPHVPVGASDAFRGKSEYGPYGDSIEEIDWSTGVVLDTLRECGIDENTLVIFTSDNGPWIETTRGMSGEGRPFIPRDHSGTADPLRGFKMLTWEGGLRVPCVMRWPGHIPAGTTCDEVAATIDFLPTFANLAGSEPPKDRTLDGRDFSALLKAPEDAASPHEVFCYYQYVHLQAIRQGRWKLVLPRAEQTPWTGWSGRFVNNGVESPELYDMSADPAESRNLAAEQPEIVEKMLAVAEAKRNELGDYDRVGTGARFHDEGPKRPDMWRPRANSGAPAAPKNNAAFKPTPYDNAEPVGNLRFDFESGDLQGWCVVEGELGPLVSSRKSLPRWTDLPYNRQGEYHLSTLVADAEMNVADSLIGVVESPRFVLEGDRMSFLIGGGSGETACVVLCGEDGKQLMRASGQNGPIMRRVTWDVGDHRGKTLYLRIIDRRPSNWGHVTFDDFSTEGRLAD